MAALPEFKLDPKWIQEHLKAKVPLTIIRDALEFLTENGFLVEKADGKVGTKDEALQCIGDVFWTAQTQYHTEMFRLATESMRNTSETERNLEGLTFAVDAGRFEKIRDLLKNTMNQIEALVHEDGGGPGEAVFQVELALFPLTDWKKG
jgi:uncharacterized protein (TIGR02147 family)